MDVIREIITRCFEEYISGTVFDRPEYWTMEDILSDDEPFENPDEDTSIMLDDLAADIEDMIEKRLGMRPCLDMDTLNSETTLDELVHYIKESVIIEDPSKSFLNI